MDDRNEGPVRAEELNVNDAENGAPGTRRHCHSVQVVAQLPVAPTKRAGGRKSMSGGGRSPNVIVRFPQATIDKLQRRAVASGKKRSEVVRELVEAGLRADSDETTATGHG
jgi:hypothetical protein